MIRFVFPERIFWFITPIDSIYLEYYSVLSLSILTRSVLESTPTRDPLSITRTLPIFLDVTSLRTSLACALEGTDITSLVMISDTRITGRSIVGTRWISVKVMCQTSNTTCVQR